MISVDSQLCSNLYARKNLICWVGDFNKNFGVPSFVWKQNFTGQQKGKLQTQEIP